MNNALTKYLLLTLVIFLSGMLGFSMGRMENIKVDRNSSAGNYLADSRGMTLYYFKNDGSDVSNWMPAPGAVDNWPAFYMEDLSALPGSLDQADFRTITRPDGSLQTTFRGAPLYYFRADTKPGDAKGDGRNAAWFILNPYSFRTTESGSPSVENPVDSSNDY